jgi:hypothetical protein
MVNMQAIMNMGVQVLFTNIEVCEGTYLFATPFCNTTLQITDNLL